MTIFIKAFKFIPFTVAGLVGGFVGGLVVSMTITKLKGGNPWNESTDPYKHTKIIVPLATVGGALYGATKCMRKTT